MYGAYALESVNGQPLPYTTGIQYGRRSELVGAMLTLREDRTFIDHFSFRSFDDPGGGNVLATETEDTGTFSVSGNELTIDPFPPIIIEGATLTRTQVSLTYRYRKR